MLTLLTGLPGHGKTLYLMSTLHKEYEGRSIYYHGIKDCMMPWESLPNPHDWYKLPDGSVIFVDEAQQWFPRRYHSAKVPLHCSQFETHRHKGFDVVLLTQKPKLVDHHLRELTGRHIHVFRSNTGHEFANVYIKGSVFDIKDKEALSTAEKQLFKYPREAYQLYKSAEIHTVKKYIPLKFFVFPVLLCLLVVGILFMVSKIRAPSLLDQSSQAVSSPEVEQGDIGLTVEQAVKRSLDYYLMKHSPRLDNVPYSSPFYDGVYVAKTYPRPQCIASVSRCQCYTQQATKLAIDDATCRDYVANGYFDPTLEDDNNDKRRERVRSTLHSTTATGI